jgi:hypothetical protein
MFIYSKIEKVLPVDIVKKDREKKGEEYPSLYDAFQLGDRVMRVYRDKYGKKTEYKGIVLRIERKGVEVYWDTKDGKYKPGEMNISFTHCEVEEIFKGDQEYTPIKKDRSYF